MGAARLPVRYNYIRRFVVRSYEAPTGVGVAGYRRDHGLPPVDDGRRFGGRPRTDDGPTNSDDYGTHHGVVDGHGGQRPDVPRWTVRERRDGFLYASHTQTLSNTSFQAQWTKLDTTDSRNDIHWQKSVRAEFGTSLAEWSRPDGGPVTMFRASGGSFWRERIDDGATYGRDDAGFDLEAAVWGIEIGPLIDAFAWSEPTLVDGDTPAVWEVSAEAVDDEAAIPGHQDGTVAGVSQATMCIDERGFVRSVDAVYAIRNARDGGQRREFAVTFSVSSVGETNVETPSWLSTAREQVPTASASLTENRRAVALTVDAGSPLEADTRISVFERDSEEKIIAYLSSPLEPGDCVYFQGLRRRQHRGAVAGRHRLLRGADRRALAGRVLRTGRASWHLEVLRSHRRGVTRR